MDLSIAGVIAILGTGMLLTRVIEGKPFVRPGVQPWVTSFGVGLSVIIILFLAIS